ncbi:LPS export ABC transporter permease LptG [Pokkaliibacter sp. CJK22405]|uniref:LPS export ABC transporter permease LptG n=1 Tax=Pokkaliibacter sp. CJK22405 TaxID=3384615 RepID=UPI003984B642
MKTLDLYIARYVLGCAAMALLVLFGLDVLFAFLDELDDLGSGYTIGKIALYLLYSSPASLYEMLPVSALMGALIGLGLLAANSELTIMRAAGLSLTQLARSLMYPTLLIMILVLAVGEWLVPYALPKAESIRAVALGKQDKYASQYGVWHREGNAFMYFNAVDSEGVIHGLTEYDFDEDMTLKQTRVADEAVYQNGQWQLTNVQQVSLGEKQTQREVAATATWQTELTPNLLRLVVLDPLYLSVQGLWKYGSYLKEQGLDSSNYWLAFWQKVLQPLSIFGLVLIGMSFVFGPLRSVSMGQRVVSGLIVGVVFRLSQQLLGPVVTLSGVSPLLAVLIPIGICIGVGLLLLRKVR